MGKRRIRNLQKFKNVEIFGFDIKKDRRKQVENSFKIQTFDNLSAAIKKKPDCMVISTPPDSHKKFANMAINKNIHFFTEVNLSSKDTYQIIKKMKKSSIIAAPSCTMKFHPIVKKIKQLLEKNTIGDVLYIQHHFGHYLPNWHPWEDYRKFYVSVKKTGAAKEVIPFELIWLTYLFSEIKSVFGNVNKISKLETNIDDIYQAFLEFKNGILCTLIVDVFSIPSFNETKILGEKGSIICNFNEGIIKINKGKNWKVIKLKRGKMAKGYKGNTPSEHLYEEEMGNLINAIKKKSKYPHSFIDELKILKVLDGIEISSKKKKTIFM